MKPIFAALLGIAIGLHAPAASAPTAYVEGRDYIRLDQAVRTTNPSKIEVAVVFSFHSADSFHLEPALQAWIRQQPADVDLQRVHAMWNPQMEPLLRGYCTSVALKIADMTLMPTYKAMHLEHKHFRSVTDWADLFAGFGIDRTKTISTYNSFGVTSQLRQAEARVRGYKITGTPEMVVDGKYRISGRLPGGHPEMLKVADFLIAIVRAERGLAP